MQIWIYCNVGGKRVAAFTHQCSNGGIFRRAWWRSRRLWVQTCFSPFMLRGVLEVLKPNAIASCIRLPKNLNYNLHLLWSRSVTAVLKQLTSLPPLFWSQWTHFSCFWRWTAGSSRVKAVERSSWFVNVFVLYFMKPCIRLMRKYRLFVFVILI